MKKLYTTLSLVVLLSGGSVSAGVATGNSTEWTQLLNNVQLLFSGAREAVTAVQQTIETAKVSIGNPFLAAMITGAQQQAAREMNNWARGNFEGNSTLISNPDTFIKNAGLEVVRGTTLSVTGGNKIGDSVLGAVVNSFRGQGDLQSQLLNISKSELVSMTRENICPDAKMNQFVMSQGYTLGTPEFTVAKQRANITYCSGPITDPTTARNLQALANISPAVNGLEGYLAITSGDNDFTRNFKSTEAANRAAQTAREAATKELDRGSGAISQRKCVKYFENDDDGNAYPQGTAPCKEYENVASAGQVNVTLNKAATAGLDRLTSLGPDGFASMLGGYFFNAISSTVVSSLRNTNDVGGGSVAANNTWLGITPGTGQTITNTAVSRPLTTVATPDLTGPTDPIKISMVTPLFKMLSSYEEALNDLEDVDTDYQTQAEQIWTLYQNRTYGQVLASVQACYDQLMSIDPNLSNLSPAQTAQAQADMDLLKARATTFAAGNDLLNSDGTKIDAARKLVADTRTRINRSNSSAEINSIFSTFQNALDVDSLPSITEAAARTSQFEKIKRVLGGDLRLPGNNTPAILENISNRCSNEYLPQAQGIQPPTQTDSVSGA